MQRVPSSLRGRVRAGRLVAAVASTALAATVLAPAAAQASSPTTSATTALTLTSKATLGIPKSVAPGYHTFVLTQSAAQAKKDPRGLTVEQLAKGYTRAQFKADLAKTFGDHPDLKAYARVTKNVAALGGVELESDFTITGKAFTVLLKPGTYVLDNGPTEEGAFDNFSILTVKGTAAGAKPKTVGTITSKEFAYKIVGARKGLHTYALHNAGAQIHMYVMFRLDKGHSEQELFALLNSQTNGPPPAWVHNGGFAGVVSAGQTMYTTLNLSTNSDYEFICFMPDVKTGAPHFALGMHRFFHVK
jgi:hypothetical protein